MFLKEFSEIVWNSYFSKQLHDWKGKRVITKLISIVILLISLAFML